MLLVDLTDAEFPDLVNSVFQYEVIAMSIFKLGSIAAVLLVVAIFGIAVGSNSITALDSDSASFCCCGPECGCETCQCSCTDGVCSCDACYCEGGTDCDNCDSSCQCMDCDCVDCDPTNCQCKTCECADTAAK